MLVFELIAVLRGTVGDDDIHVVAYPQIYLPKGEQSFLASFFSNPAGGHIPARPPWTSTTGPDHACMMVTVRVADFGRAAPPSRGGEVL